MEYPREESSQAHLLLEQLGLKEGEGQRVPEEAATTFVNASTLSVAWWCGGVWGGVQLGTRKKQPTPQMAA
jgi:hypothetical protein